MCIEQRTMVDEEECKTYEAYWKGGGLKLEEKYLLLI